LKGLFATTLIVVSTFASAEVSWIQSTALKLQPGNYCNELLAYVSEKNSESQRLVDAGLTKLGVGSASIWTFDLNQDNSDDYFIVYSGPGECGSAGCSSTLFVTNAHGCKVVSTPNWHSSAPIGIDGSKVYFATDQESCAVWVLKDDRLEHQENSKHCDSDEQ